MNPILRNTLFLYARMFIVMIVSLYTTRIVLSSLGESDYGLFGSVAGVVIMFTFMTGSLSNATSRFLSFSMGKQQNKDMSNFSELYPTPLVFRTSWRIHLYLAAAVVVIGLSAGWYMVNYWLKIPLERLSACRIVLFVVIIRTIFTTLQIPLNALIIANERMGVFALLGLIDAFGNLFIAFAIQDSAMDRLVLYASLGILINICTFITLFIACRRFSEFQFIGSVDFSLLRQMTKYTIWSLTASLGATLRTNGIVALVQKYFGSVADAPIVLSQKVCTTINNFTQNFATASNPQIIKQWAGGNIPESQKLVTMASRLTWTLLSILCLPLFLETEFIMKLWLKDAFIPEAVLYTRIMLISSMVDAFSFSAAAAIQATGHVARYNIVTSGIIVLSVPVAWILYELGFGIESALWCICAASILSQIARLSFLHILTGFKIGDYARRVLLPCFGQLTLAVIIPLLLFLYLEDNTVNALIIIATGAITTIACGWRVIRPWLKK